MSDPLEVLLHAMERRSGPAIELGLDRIQRLLAQLGHPEERLPPVIHIAGTNGKGSLAAYLTAIGEAAGLKVHRYSSPHLVRFNERIYLSGKTIADESLLAILQRVQQPADALQATFFEATTAAAFLAFSEMPADMLILETGLGGRLDATNVIAKPRLCAITPISLDHQNFLGTTIAQIAREKAGIMKKDVPCVLAAQSSEALAPLQRASEEKASPLFMQNRDWRYERLADGMLYRGPHNTLACPAPGLTGEHQYENAALAIACIEQWGRQHIPDAAIRAGILHATWPGRLQRLPLASFGVEDRGEIELWLDGGHNPAAGEALAAWLKGRKRPTHLIWGMMPDKDAEGFLRPMRRYLSTLRIVPIQGHSEREAQEKLLNIAGEGAQVYADVEAAVRTACSEAAGPCDILICGSLYLAGDVLASLGGGKRGGPRIRA